MFHIGHLNLINNAKCYCNYLVVGVNSDELVYNYKNKMPVVKETERLAIVKNIKAVDEAVLADTLDKIHQLKHIGFDVIFIGDDWKGTDRWIETERMLKKYGVDVVFLPYTGGVSSTLLREEKSKHVAEYESGKR